MGNAHGFFQQRRRSGRWAHRPAGCGWSRAPRAGRGRPASSPRGRHPPSAARYSVWPGKAKPAPSFSAFLWIGRGADGRGVACLHQADGAGDDLDHACGIGGVGDAGVLGAGKGWMSTGRIAGSQRCGLRRVVNRLPMPCRAGRWRGITNPEERHVGPKAMRAFSGDFRADARRFAAGQRDGAGHAPWLTARG